MTDTAGYSGPLGVFDATTDFSELFFLVQQITNRNATAMLVQVKAVRGGGVGAPAVVDVQPLVHQIDGQGQITAHGTVPNLPCFRYAAGPFAVIIDPQVGDIGLAVFASHDISTVKNTKAAAAPGSRRRYDWADGLYFGAFLTGAATQYIRFDSAGLSIVAANQVTVEAPNVTVNASTKATVTSPEVDVNASSKVVVTSPDVELGGAGGLGVARIGDAVTGGVITGGSTHVKAI